MIAKENLHATLLKPMSVRAANKFAPTQPTAAVGVTVGATVAPVSHDDR